MSADVALIRRAAALMRARATCAPVPAGPWETEFSDVIRTDVLFGAIGYLIAECATIPEAKHVASWHPAVALAVADWLDAEAESHESEAFAEWSGVTDCCRMPQALAVARAYLGASA